MPALTAANAGQLTTMRNGYFIGLAAGLVSAIVFASATTGPLPLRVLLFFLTPLPLYLAGLALGWRAALAGAGAGTAFLALAVPPAAALAFAACEAMPAVALTFLATLYRDSGPLKGPAGVEWYPVGRIVMWAAFIGAGLSIATLLLAGASSEALLEGIKAAARNFIEKQLPEGTRAPLDDAEITQIAKMSLGFLPAMSALSWTAGHLGNLWLAGRITRASGHLTRPWPDLAATWLPSRLPALLAAGLVAASFADDPVRMIGAALAGSLFLAYLLQGLAIAHYTSRGQSWRPFALSTLYAAMILLNAVTPLVVAMLGLAETVRPIRQFPPPGQPPPTV